MRNLKKSLQRGQTLVEFALVIPVFLLLTAGFLDLGRAVYYYSAIHNAAREGARYAVVRDLSDALVVGQVKDVVRDSAVAVGLSLINIDVDIDPSIVSASRTVNVAEVCVTHEFSPITPFIAEILGSGNTIPMGSCSRMILEQ